MPVSNKYIELQKKAIAKGYWYMLNMEELSLMKGLILLTGIQKWLRDEKKVFVHVEPYKYGGKICFEYTMLSNDGFLLEQQENIDCTKTFETVLMEGIDRVLTLID